MDLKEIQEISNNFPKDHSFLAEEVLIPNLNKCDLVRVNMFDNHLPQTVVLANPEPPNVFTSFENQVGKYSSSYKLSDRKWTIIKKVVKNEMNSTFICIDEDNNIEIFNIKPAERITERYGYKYSKSIIDKDTGDDIEEGEAIYRSTSYDDDMNFMYGVNLNAVYLSYDNLTYEDACVISQSAAEKLKCYSVDEFDVTLNTNDILINLYGDKNNFKCLPNIGEVVNDTKFVSRRRINYESLLYDLSSNNLNEVNYDTDTVFYAYKNSTMYDIDVFCNADIEKLKTYPYYKQIVDFLEDQNRYYREIVETLQPYVEDDEYKLSEDVEFFYARALDMINPNTVFKDDGNTFDNLVLKIKTINVNPLVIGCKLSGRCGNKGVVSIILPDSKMPTNEFGQVADICLNPTGEVANSLCQVISIANLMNCL